MDNSLWMYSCHQASRLISDALERKLAPTERLRLRMHLMFCKMCRDYEQNIHLLETTLIRMGDLNSEGSQLTDKEMTLISSNLKTIQTNVDDPPKP